MICFDSWITVYWLSPVVLPIAVVVPLLQIFFVNQILSRTQKKKHTSISHIKMKVWELIKKHVPTRLDSIFDLLILHVFCLYIYEYAVVIS